MGYLQVNCSSVDLTKAIASIWFRVPNAMATSVDNSNFFPFLPLVSMGAAQTVNVRDIDTFDSGCLLSPEYYDRAGGTIPFQVGPSCIGVLFEPGQAWSPSGRVACILQTSITPSYIGNYFGVTAVDCGVPPNTPGRITTVDQSSLFAFNDSYIGPSLPFGAGDSADGPTPVPLVAPDKWHHILLSWDLSNGCATHGLASPFTDTTQNFVDAVSKMWFAFDDVNRTADSLPSRWANDLSVTQVWGPNDIISQGVSYIAHGPDSGGQPSSVLAGGGPVVNQFNIPGPASTIYSSYQQRYTLPNYHSSSNPVCVAEMGEFQMFAGISLDTSVIDNRRLFVTSDGKPTKMGTAQTALGTRPIIALSGQSNFKAGKSTGSLGNLSPVGTISNFTPGPSLS